MSDAMDAGSIFKSKFVKINEISRILNQKQYLSCMHGTP